MTTENENNDTNIVLVAEDNEHIQDLLKLQLDLLGYEAVVVENGLEALNEWKKGHYSLILTDCNMPVMDGFELADEIRKQEAGSDRHIPIVAVTADTTDNNKTLSNNTSFDGYIEKPLKIDLLSDELSKWLS